MGDRVSFLGKAMLNIMNDKSLKVKKCSLIYETDAWGKKKQNKFLNAVININTRLGPKNLLKKLKEIEIKAGRTKTEKWSEREIDIDILFYDDLIYEKDGIMIPHKELHNRNFVLVPLNEIAPDLRHPRMKKKVSKLLKDSKDKLKVRIYKEK
jgi:2-amino-4-hydroxy-6-hydroxymethyldihydropteridine diphosphokinase